MPLNPTGTSITGSKRDIGIDSSNIAEPIKKSSFQNAALNNLGVHKTPQSFRSISKESLVGEGKFDLKNHIQFYSSRNVPQSEPIHRKSILANVGNTAMDYGVIPDEKKPVNQNIFYGQKRKSIFLNSENMYKKGNKEDFTAYIKEEEKQPDSPLKQKNMWELKELDKYRYL